MRPFLELEPTTDQNFRIIGHGSRGNLTERLEQSFKIEEQDIEKACMMRFEAFHDIVSTLPDDEQSIVELDRNHPNTFAAMKIIYCSAIDHYLEGNYEIAAAQLEMLIDCDGEDPLEATEQLALCYMGLGDWECLEDIMGDLSDKRPIVPLIGCLKEFVQSGAVTTATAKGFDRFKEYAAEFRATQHPADEQYAAQINSERPSRAALARQFYLSAAPMLMSEYDGFIESLNGVTA